MLRSIPLLSLLVCAACAASNDPGSASGPTVVPPCHVGGCSGQVCSDVEGVVTTCEWRPEYACYRTARCEPQTGGTCGWSQTADLVACLEAARRP